MRGCQGAASGCSGRAGGWRSGTTSARLGLKPTCGARAAISRQSVSAVSALPLRTSIAHSWSPAGCSRGRQGQQLSAGTRRRPALPACLQEPLFRPAAQGPPHATGARRGCNSGQPAALFQGSAAPAVTSPPATWGGGWRVGTRSKACRGWCGLLKGNEWPGRQGRQGAGTGGAEGGRKQAQPVPLMSICTGRQGRGGGMYNARSERKTGWALMGRWRMVGSTEKERMAWLPRARATATGLLAQPAAGCQVRMD